MHLNELYLLYHTLLAVKTDGSVENGICTQIGSHMPRALDSKIDKWLLDSFSAWPHRSGNPSLPVSHPSLNPVRAFIDCPYWEGEYGRNRRKLLDFLQRRAKSQYSAKYKMTKRGVIKLTAEDTEAGWFFENRLLLRKSWEGQLFKSD